jgi:hypothetical protein
MDKELQDRLLIYLGELKHQQENTFDWMEKDSITEKINAVNLLLGFNTKEKTWFEKVAENINNQKQ